MMVALQQQYLSYPENNTDLLEHHYKVTKYPKAAFLCAELLTACTSNRSKAKLPRPQEKFVKGTTIEFVGKCHHFSSQRVLPDNI